MGFSRQEYWSGLPFPSPGDLPDPGIEPALQEDALTSEPPGKPQYKIKLKKKKKLKAHISGNWTGVYSHADIRKLIAQGLMSILSSNQLHQWKPSLLKRELWDLVCLLKNLFHGMPHTARQQSHKSTARFFCQGNRFTSLKTHWFLSSTFCFHSKAERVTRPVSISQMTCIPRAVWCRAIPQSQKLRPKNELWHFTLSEPEPQPIQTNRSYWAEEKWRELQTLSSKIQLWIVFPHTQLHTHTE